MTDVPLYRIATHMLAVSGCAACVESVSVPQH